MPPPRRREPAAPKAESKTGLVVSLIFFILLSIILGVTTYVGFDGQKELETKASSAAADAKKASDAEKETRARLLAYKIMTGTAEAPRGEELGALNSNDRFREELSSIRRNFESIGVSWDPKTDQPPIHILAAMKALQEAKNTAEANMRTALAAADKAKTDYEQLQATAEQARKTAQEKQKQLADALVQAQKDVEEAKLHGADEISKLGAQIKANAGKHDEEMILERGKTKRQAEELEGKTATIEKYKRDQDAERVKVFLTDKVHGVVSKVDSASGLAYINLGSADYVRPGMTFSILQKYDNSRVGIETELLKKATLEVTQVMGAKQSQARIRYAEGVSSIATPVEQGDKLYKPGWQPGTPVRWALAGHFDLNGLGRDETILLKNQLAKQGIVVSAYLDLNTLKVVGELNYDVSYLVVGNRPTGETARVIGEERKQEIENAINDMVKKAQDMGIVVMPHKAFLPVAGIDLPRQQVFPYFPAGGAAPGSEKRDDDGN